MNRIHNRTHTFQSYECLAYFRKVFASTLSTSVKYFQANLFENAIKVVWRKGITVLLELQFISIFLRQLTSLHIIHCAFIKNETLCYMVMSKEAYVHTSRWLLWNQQNIIVFEWSTVVGSKTGLLWEVSKHTQQNEKYWE